MTSTTGQGLLGVAVAVAATYVIIQNYQDVEDAYLINYATSHRRFTPTSHSFSYPLTLALFKLDNRSERSRLFRESRRMWSLLRVDPRGYLTTSYNDLSIIANLRRTLDDRGYSENTAHSAYLMTMPTTLGMSNINPLSIYFCYDDKRRHTLTIFEVHNTYGERSMYIIPNDDSTRISSSEYTHQSFQPRSFFVSPMNDRQGFYNLQASVPFNFQNQLRPPKIRVTYYDQDEKLKFTANLVPSGEANARKISLKSVVIHLSTRPFTNLLTFARILYQALYLHYFKNLAFYPKPNIGVTLNTKANPTQSLDESGSLGFDAEPYLCFHARKAIEKTLHSAVRRHSRVKVIITYTDPLISPTEIGEGADDTLTLNIRSYEFFTQMLISPNVDYIINVLGSRCEDMVRISDDDLFRRLLSLDENSSLSNNSTSSQAFTVANWLAGLRRAHAKWILHQSPDATIDFDVSRTQAFDKPLGDSWMVLIMAIAISVQLRLFAFLFTLLGVRFKPCQTPWKPLDRLQ
ncbi:hypothetical protein E3P91_03573 [Wallemia ichthyophaga]|nr:hypothetical protein E3P91_03573 [Wallemia ichthyophaga]TIB59018.1 hypothetical protein E3P78_03725 [Wallemia ichthyophaga]